MQRAERAAARRGYHHHAAWIPSLLCVESITPGVDTINDTSKDASIPGAWIHSRRRVPSRQIPWGPSNLAGGKKWERAERAAAGRRRDETRRARPCSDRRFVLDVS
jgi:hypothetical protein